MEAAIFRTTFLAGVAALACQLASPAQAAGAAEFDRALATATQHATEAAAAKNQWPATTTALSAAKKAAEAGNFDQAVALADQADALARASLYQTQTEATRWKDAEIR